VTSRHARVPHPVPTSQRHRLMSFTANGIERHFSKPISDVKAFRFVQTNREVVRRVSETRAAILSTKIRKQRICDCESMACEFKLLIYIVSTSVIPGHSRSKNGVAPLTYVPGIHVFICHPPPTGAARSGHPDDRLRRTIC
jgi:hypothetical protein